ncbi:hypothetical protein [Streptomyces otsuchiensis]|uniref:hypothetical protein n=1 Tax=Streptomyces otsuchiensis TaxID=2681388 RepID=UPI00103134ED|nr:hypothetical protein [Streptomyces otsuchiensis]
MTRSTAWLRAAAPAAALTLALTACGSGDGSGDDGDGSDGTGESTAQQENGGAAEGDDGDDDGDAGDGSDGGSDSEPGVISLDVGDSSEAVRWTNGASEAMLVVTATDVHVGEPEDIDPELFTSDVEEMRPVHVHLMFDHADGEDIAMLQPSERTTLKLLLADDEGWGENVQSYIELGMPNGCDDATAINAGELPSGESFYDCRTFLIPEETEPAEVHWLAADETLVWSL